MTRTRTQVGRAQVGGLSLLLAVALLAAAGSGAETARRMASAGAGLAYAMVVEPRPASVGESLSGSHLALVGIADSRLGSRAVRYASAGGCAAEMVCVLVVAGCIDLPPPSRRL